MSGSVDDVTRSEPSQYQSNTRAPAAITNQILKNYIYVYITSVYYILTRPRFASIVITDERVSQLVWRLSQHFSLLSLRISRCCRMV